MSCKKAPLPGANSTTCSTASCGPHPTSPAHNLSASLPPSAPFPPYTPSPPQVLLPYLREALASHAAGKSVDQVTLTHLVHLCSMLVNAKVYDLAQWRPALVPYLAPAVGEAAAEQVAAAFLARAVKVGGWSGACLIAPAALLRCQDAERSCKGRVLVATPGTLDAALTTRLYA